MTSNAEKALRWWVLAEYEEDYDSLPLRRRVHMAYDLNDALNDLVDKWQND